MKNYLGLFACVILASSLVVGCGDDDGDGDGSTADADTSSDVLEASFTMTPDCTMAATDEISFSSTSVDPEGDELTCSWTFASGTPSTADGCEVTGVTFPNAAPYDVTLTVDDGNGNTDTATTPIAPCA